MKRFLIVLFIVLIVPMNVCAESADEQDEYSEYLNSYDFSFFEDSLGKDTYSVLENLGLSSFDYDNINALSLDDVFGVLKDIAKGKFISPLEGIAAVIVYILLSSFFQSLKSGDSDMNELFSTVSAVIIAVILVVKISPSISLATTCISVSADFIYAFVPVFCAIVAVGGGLTTSFSTNSLLLLLAQGMNILSSNLFMPIVNCFLSIGICSGLRAELHLDKLVYSLKKILTSSISFLAGGFVSILSLKTTIGARTDILGIRSIRFVLNSVVPVVGGALSEGLVSIQSYSSLVKSSVGIVGIIAVALVFLPAIIDTALWRLVLSVSLIICDVFEDKSVSLVIKAFKDTMLIINVVLIVSMMTTIISIGILIAARTA